MKNLVAILQVFLCLIAGSCKNATDNNSLMTDLNAANLKGNVYRVKETYNKVGDACCPAGDRGECSQKLTIYNKDGFTVESAKIGVNGDTINRSIHMYNDLKECLTVENFSDSNLISREINNVKNGLVTSVKIISKDGNVLNKHEFIYNNGMLTKGTTSGHEGKILNIFENKYKDGRVETAISKVNDDKVFSITRYKRNRFGDVIEEFVKHPGDNSEYTLYYEYEYDEADNWIRQKKLYNDDIISMKIREIEYYPADLANHE